MRKELILIALILGCANISFAQSDVKKDAVTAANEAATKSAKSLSDTTNKKAWTIKNTLTLNAEQSMYENWVPGGVGNIAFSAFFKGFYNYSRNLLKWDNSVELSYGKMRQDDNGKGIFDKGNRFRKNEDKIELNSIAGYKAFQNWNYSALVNFKSQFDDGFKNDTILVSSFLSPSYLITSVGLEYKPRPYLSVLISPLTGRTTFVTNKDLAVLYGLTKEKPIDFALGSYIKIFFEKEVFKNVHVLSKLEFFSDYRKESVFFKNTDVNFETFITMKVNKYLSAFFNIQLVYDKDMSDKMQLKERFGISVPISF